MKKGGKFSHLYYIKQSTGNLPMFSLYEQNKILIQHQKKKKTSNTLMIFGRRDVQFSNNSIHEV